MNAAWDLAHLIDLDARVHALVQQALHERLASSGGLVQCLLEKDYTGDVVSNGSCHVQLAVATPNVLKAPDL